MKNVRNYTVTDKKLGTGGLGSVYYAVRRINGTEVELPAACKIVRHDLAHHVGQQRSLASEAILGLGLSHQNLVQVLDCICQDGQSYLFMEMIEGASLEELLAHYGRLPDSIVLAVMYAVAQALQYLHGRGILHRDIAPANIILSNSGEIKLIDLGFARTVEDDNPAIARAAFACPFRVQTKRHAKECDLWALLVTGFYAVSGRLPFGPNKDDIQQSSRTCLHRVFCRAKFGEIAPFPSGVSEVLCTLLDDLNRPSIEERLFRSADDVLVYLDQYIKSRATQDMLAQCVVREPGGASEFYQDTEAIQEEEIQATTLEDTLPYTHAVNRRKWWLQKLRLVVMGLIFFGLPLALVPSHDTSQRQTVSSVSLPGPNGGNGADKVPMLRARILDFADRAGAAVLDVVLSSKIGTMSRIAKQRPQREARRKQSSFAGDQQISVKMVNYRDTDIPVNEGMQIPLPR